MDEESIAIIKEGKTDCKAAEDKREGGGGKVIDEVEVVMMCVCRGGEWKISELVEDNVRTGLEGGA